MFLITGLCLDYPDLSSGVLRGLVNGEQRLALWGSGSRTQHLTGRYYDDAYGDLTCLFRQVQLHTLCEGKFTAAWPWSFYQARLRLEAQTRVRKKF